MNEEIRDKAKFYLKQYAENLSDRIGQIKPLISQEERCLERITKYTDPESVEKQNYQRDYYTNRLNMWKDRLVQRTEQLEGVEEVISKL